MISAPRLETQTHAHCRCWCAADTAGTYLVTALVRATMPKVTTTAPRKPPITRSPFGPYPTRAAKSAASPTANTTRTPEPPAKSP